MKKLSPLLLLAAAGCIELEQDFTLNPDGTGKVVVRWVAAPMEIGPAKSPEARAQSLLKDEVTKSEGVDAWKDVTCKARDDGKFEFRGTAYFKDFSQLKLHNTGFKLMRLKLSKDAAGQLVVVNEPKTEDAPAKALSDDEAKKKLKEERAQYQQTKRMIEMLLADLKVTARIQFPGRIGQATNFKKDGESAVRLTLEGKTFLKVLDELIMNDEWMLKVVRSGPLQDAGPGDELLAEKVFGEKGPVRAVTTGELKPNFDYESEAAPARKAWEAFAATLGAGPIGPAAKGGDFKSLKVAGVKYRHEDASERGLGYEDPGLELNLIGELPGTILKAKEGRVNRAMTDAGESLLPMESDRTIRMIQLSTDSAAIAFDVRLLLPPAGAKGLKEVSGVITYIVGGKIKEVDLGFEELKEGAKGKNAEITGLEESKWEEGSQSLDLRLEMSNDLIESIVVKDATGAVLKTKQTSSMTMNDVTTRSLTLKGAYPAKGRIYVKVYDDLKSYEIPFKIENVDLLGRPLK
jgi:hypothetical protein